MKEELISKKCAENMENIQMSEETKALLLCRAKMRDIYITVYNVINKVYPYAPNLDVIIGGFSDKFNALDDVLMEAIDLYIKENTFDSDYTQM